MWRSLLSFFVVDGILSHRHESRCCHGSHRRYYSRWDATTTVHERLYKLMHSRTKHID